MLRNRLADLFDGCRVGGRRDRPIDEQRAIEHALGRIVAGGGQQVGRRVRIEAIRPIWGRRRRPGWRARRATAARARDCEPWPRRAPRRQPARAARRCRGEWRIRLLGELGHRHAGRRVDGVGGDHAKPRHRPRPVAVLSEGRQPARRAEHARGRQIAKTLVMPTVARADAAAGDTPSRAVTGARRISLASTGQCVRIGSVRQPAPTQTSRVLAGRVREINTAGVRATAVPYSHGLRADGELASRYAFLVSAPRYSVAPSVADSPVLSPNDETPASE